MTSTGTIQASITTEAKPQAGDGASRAPAVHSLDDLAALSIAELTAVYEAGRVPDSMAALDGKPTCRMLTLVGALGHGRAATGLRAFARSQRFPWAGKTFTATSAAEGHGINRIRLAGARNWFPFDTRIEPSVIDGHPCVVLDYDKSENPWFIRHIHDELKEVAGGLFLGPAMWKGKAQPSLLLYFACHHSGG